MTAGAFATEFLDCMPHTVEVEAWDGTFDIEGEPNRSTAIQMRCRIEEKIRRVRNLAGEDRVSMSTLYVAGGPIGPLDRLTMPSTFKGPTNPPIINVSNQDDAQSYDHSEVYI